MKTVHYGWPALWIAIFAAPLSAQDRTVTATGTAVVKAEADVIWWTITAIDEGPTLLKAKPFSDKRVDKIRKGAQSLVVKAEDIQIGNATVQKKYNPAGDKKLIGYQMRRTIRFPQYDLKRLDEFLQQLASTQTEYEEVEFHYAHTQMDRLREEALEKAAKNALQNAVTLALAMRGKTGYPVTIEEIPHPPPGSSVNPGKVEVRKTVEATFEFKWVGGRSR